MKSFTKLTSKIIPLPNTDVDTDQIIPARYLKVIDKSGLAEGLFDSWRRLEDGSPTPISLLIRMNIRARKFCSRATISAVVLPVNMLLGH